jgi:hypothetical protein
MAKFGRPYVVQLGSSDGEPTVVGALFCYVVLLLSTYLCCYLAGKAVGRKRRRKNGTHPD